MIDFFFLALENHCPNLSEGKERDQQVERAETGEEATRQKSCVGLDLMSLIGWRNFTMNLSALFSDLCWAENNYKLGI